MMEKVSEQPVLLRFAKPHAPYMPGEVAGFRDLVLVRKLVALGVAAPEGDEALAAIGGVPLTDDVIGAAPVLSEGLGLEPVRHAQPGPLVSSEGGTSAIGGAEREVKAAVQAEPAQKKVEQSAKAVPAKK